MTPDDELSAGKGTIFNDRFGDGNKLDYECDVYDDDAVCDGKDWQTCWCEDCIGRREDYADMLYQRKRDEEFDK